MSAKHIYRLLAIFLGYGLIICGFFVFGENLQKETKYLDIFMSCLIFTQFVEFTLFPLVNLSERAHKEIGMMGLHLLSVNLCCILSIAVMALGIGYEWAFKAQLIAQLGIIFIALIGRLATLHAGEKVEECYVKEQKQVMGRQMLRSTMDMLVEDAIQAKSLDAKTRNRIQEISEEIRFITPSALTEAQELDQQFCLLAETLRVMMRDVAINQGQIAEETERLNRILEKRRNVRAS